MSMRGARIRPSFLRSLLRRCLFLPKCLEQRSRVIRGVMTKRQLFARLFQVFSAGISRLELRFVLAVQLK